MKDFIPYDIALNLKQLGFDDECLFVKLIGDNDSTAFYTLSDYKLFPHRKDKELGIPLFSQAFRWFRNKFELIHEIIFYKSKSGVEYEYVIYSLVLPKDDELGSEDEMRSDNSWEGDDPIKLDTNWQTYSSYEEAEVKCLEELIKIANLKLCNSTMP